ncbi:MAG: hypothetical protein ACLP01_00650 [Solirubrobacteraceae bacterium]
MSSTTTISSERADCSGPRWEVAEDYTIADALACFYVTGWVWALDDSERM